MLKGWLAGALGTVLILWSSLLPAHAKERCEQAGNMPGPFYVYFDVGSAKIKPSEADKIRDMAKRAKSLYVQQICLLGRASKQGAASYNTKLSRNRAEAIRQALVREGVMRGHIHIDATGEPFGRNLNFLTRESGDDRRVDVIFAR